MCIKRKKNVDLYESGENACSISRTTEQMQYNSKQLYRFNIFI